MVAVIGMSPHCDSIQSHKQKKLSETERSERSDYAQGLRVYTLPSLSETKNITICHCNSNDVTENKEKQNRSPSDYFKSHVSLTSIFLEELHPRVDHHGDYSRFVTCGNRAFLSHLMETISGGV